MNEWGPNLQFLSSLEVT